MPSGSNTMIIGGAIHYQNRTSRGMDILMEWVATGAFHNSDELYDVLKCHPRTRVAVLDDIMQWVNESESTGDDFMLWLFGPAGAGKSAIAKKIAEIAAERGLLIGDFFFSRTSPTRHSKDRLIATIAYQLTVSIPGTRSYIEDAIEQDPAIFNKNILTQIDTLLIKPFQSISSTQIAPPKKLIIIDGLDECNNSKAQVAILEAISRSFPQYNLPIKFLVVSRPEISIVTSFTTQEPLKSIHRRLALDDTYKPNDDILLFFSDEFERIRLTHPLRSSIPISWPTQEMLDTLVRKSSGQFIYASTVVKFVESICHQPSARLNIILGVSPPGRTNPFAELDALYNHLLSSVDDIQLTLHVLSLYIMTPRLASIIHYSSISMSPELFLSLEPGDMQLALINLPSIVTYQEQSGSFKSLHASLVDFLSDKRRSTTFYIDMPLTCTDFVRRIFQYVKGPDGIQAGDIDLFFGVYVLSPWVTKGQLRSDILDFDFDAFIKASIRRRYKEPPYLIRGYMINVFEIWIEFLGHAGLEDEDKKEALDRLNKSLESRLQIYQSHWRLRLLLPLTVTRVTYPGYCRYVDILLEMDDHDLHLLDQDALDLRHAYTLFTSKPGTVIDMIASCLDGDTYALAALHCMRFLSNPPKHSERNEFPEMGLLFYGEWKATCNMTLKMLCKLLQQANTLPELVQFISNHDIHPAVQKGFFTVESVAQVNVHILAFLSRANVCINWRILSAIKRSLVIFDQPPIEFDEYDDERTTLPLIRQRLDQCCLNAAHIGLKPVLSREIVKMKGIAQEILNSRHRAWPALSPSENQLCSHLCGAGILRNNPRRTSAFRHFCKRV